MYQYLPITTQHFPTTPPPYSKQPALNIRCITRYGLVLKKKWGRTPETRLRQRFLNNLGLLIHVGKNCCSGSLVLSCYRATFSA